MINTTLLKPENIIIISTVAIAATYFFNKFAKG